MVESVESNAKTRVLSIKSEMKFKIRQNIKIFRVRILSPNVLPVLTEKAVKQNLFAILLR